MKEIIKTAKELIGKSESKEAIDFLQDNIPEEKKHLHNQLWKFEGEFKDINQYLIKGTVSIGEISVMKNNVTDRFLNWLTTIEDPNYEQGASNHQSTKAPIENNLSFYLSLIMIVITMQNALIHSHPGVMVVMVGILLLATFLKFKKTEFTPVKKFDLNISYESGIYGGLIGGVLLGLFIAISYYYLFNGNHKGSEFIFIRQCILIVPFSAVAGIVIGFLSTVGIRYFEKLHLINRNVSIIFGGILGTTIATVFMSFLGAILFVENDLPTAPIEMVVMSILIGFLSIALGLLFYKYRGKAKYIFRVLLIALTILFILSIIIYMVISQTGIEEYLRYAITKGKTEMMQYQAGALFGLILGVIGGSLIPITIVLYENWNYADKQRIEELTS